MEHKITNFRYSVPTYITVYSKYWKYLEKMHLLIKFKYMIKINRIMVRTAMNNKRIGWNFQWIGQLKWCNCNE